MAEPFPDWRKVQDEVKKEQKEANENLANGSDPVAVPGFPNSFTRAEALHYAAQLRNQAKHGSQLPGASAYGLAIEPGMTREKLDKNTLDDDQAILDEVVKAGNFTEEELAEADERLEDQLERGILLDPRTVSN